MPVSTVYPGFPPSLRQERRMVLAAVRTVSSRLQIITVPQSHTRTFADDVRTGLSAKPKSLSSKYFYDEIGSALFDAITLLPEYYLTRAETEILRTWGWEMVRALGNPIEFLELGSGSAVKTRILIDEALRVQRTLRYSPIDISREALTATAQSLVDTYPGLSVSAYAGDYFTVLEHGKIRREHRMLAMFMGSNIGNYEPAEARKLLRGIGSTLQSGDGLLIGIDLKKDRRVLELAYDDPTGVTTAFNKNLLARINRELDGEFDLREFEHVAEYEPSHGRVKSSLVSLSSQTVRIGALDASFRFRKRERIHTESSYKFSPADLSKLARASGYRVERTWSDRDGRFSVNLLLRT